MRSLLRALGQVAGFLLLVLVAVVGFAFLIGAILGWPTLAATIGLPPLENLLAPFLDAAESQDLVTGVICLSAALLAGAMLFGLLMPPRESLVALAEQPGEGLLAARRRALRAIAQARCERVRGLTRVKLHLQPKRSRAIGGKLRATGFVRPGADLPVATARLARELGAVAEPFGLEARVRAKRAEGRV